MSPKRQRRKPAASVPSRVSKKTTVSGAGSGGWAGSPPDRLALGLVLLAAAGIHRAALRAPFFADDYLFLDRVQGRSLLQSLAAPDPIGNYFRPLGRQLWFWFWTKISGGSPAAFHTANLALFLVAIALLHSIVRRAAGPRAALIAASLLAVQHAADVPILWASGSQDLLALVGALSALRLFQAGRRGWAALAFLLGLLAKEVVILTPLVAILLGRPREERWPAAAARASPLLAVLLAWGASVSLLAARRHLLGLQARIGVAEVLSTPLHLLQTVAGIEWAHASSGIFQVAPPLSLALVVIAWWWTARAIPPGGAENRTPSEAVRAGILWALLGASPVVMVAGIWSAYYYLFALGGAALALGAAVARRPAWVGALLIVLVGWTTENARRLPEFATASDPWTPRSHVNRHYLERGMAATGRYLEDLLRARPTLPRASTLFFTRIPSKVAFQSGDGPVVRWAYRDTSLRSYFLTRFRLADALRGPVFFFQAWNDSLLEVRGRDSLQRIGMGLVLSNAPEAARDVWKLAWMHDSTFRTSSYRLAVMELRLGRADSARVWLARSGLNPDAGPAPEVPQAMARRAAGDTAQAIALASVGVYRHALDPGPHALLADLLLARDGVTDAAVMESYAACILAPTLPASWRRWGMIAFVRDRNPEALAALQRYFSLAGPAARGDEQAARALAEVKRRLPGGELAQQAVRTGPGSR